MFNYWVFFGYCDYIIGYFNFIVLLNRVSLFLYCAAIADPAVDRKRAHARGHGQAVGGFIHRGAAGFHAATGGAARRAAAPGRETAQAGRLRRAPGGLVREHRPARRNEADAESERGDRGRRAVAADNKERAALEFARTIVTDRGNVSDDDVRAVRQAGYTDGEIGEIVANVALNIFTNYFNHVAGTEVDFPAAPQLSAA